MAKEDLWSSDGNINISILLVFSDEAYSDKSSYDDINDIKNNLLDKSYVLNSNGSQQRKFSKTVVLRVVF